MRVAVLRGGRSSEREVSLRSGVSVMEGLRAAGHEPWDVVIDERGRWWVGERELTLAPAGGLAGCDVAFPVLHGPFGEDGTVQGLLECLDVPYVGCDVLASAVCMDKITFKHLVARLGMAQVGFAVVGDPGWEARAGELGLPLWVKPSRLGSSVGISRVDELDRLAPAVEAARAHDPRVIVEQHAEAREIECSVIGNDEPQVSEPGELRVEGEWYDYEAKYSEGGMRLEVPAPLPAEARETIRAHAARLYAALGCSGLARCDFFYRPGGQVLVNELNTLPGFTQTSVFARLFEASGIRYPDLCDRLVSLALERHRAQRSFAF